MDENNRAFFRNFVNSSNMPEENSSTQNSEIPPNYQYSQYPPQFPNFPFVPPYSNNFQGFGNSSNQMSNVPRTPYQTPTQPYWQNMTNPYFMSPSFYGFSNPQATGMPFTSPMENEPATPTSVPETQLSERESPIEVVNLEIPDAVAENRKKRATWKKVEDEVLARSFVTISDDPIVGNDQKADAFWGRVASYYNENRPADSANRSASVIRSHWHNTIQKKVYRFNANYNSVYSLYRSGHSDEDILRFAYEKYREKNHGTAFNLEHVWRIVKDRPMFTPQSADQLVGTKKSRTSESGASNTSSNQDASLHVDRLVQDCWATKQVQRSDDDPTIFDITYRGTHTCNHSTHAVPPPASPEKQEMKHDISHSHHQPQQQNQTLSSFKSNLRVDTEDLNNDGTSAHFSFPSTFASYDGENHYFPLSDLVDGTHQGTYSGKYSPLFLSPAASESNYFTAGTYSPMKNNWGGANLQHSEADIAEIISAHASTTNSPIGGVEFSIDPVNGLDPNFPFNTTEFFTHSNFEC